jgi:predicted N-acetyltransferase YhbS
VRLREIPAQRYAREVLPLTAQLWAGRRSFEQYVAQTLELAGSRYGRRHFRTIGLYDAGKLVSSFKRYERSARVETRKISAVGFGAVFTPPEYRGRGYASVMLASALDEARAGGYDAAYLFSDIRPQFYSELGFRELPSHEITIPADGLAARRLPITPLAPNDLAVVRRCFDACERQRTAAFTRNVGVWEWIATRARHGSEHRAGQATNLMVQRRDSVRAYVLGVRMPESDAYVVDEFGFAGRGGAGDAVALLRAAAGDLRRVRGWLPPSSARGALPAGVVRKRKRGVFMMTPLNQNGRSFVDAASVDSRGDFCWATDHI